MILGWKRRYQSILKELSYSEKKDKESAVILDSILKKNSNNQKIIKLILSIHPGMLIFLMKSPDRYRHVIVLC